MVNMSDRQQILANSSSSSSFLLTQLQCCRYDATMLATPQAFARDPSLVWEFYHYRREVVSRCRCGSKAGGSSCL